MDSVTGVYIGIKYSKPHGTLIDTLSNTKPDL